MIPNLAEQLRAFGCEVEELPGWEGRGRPYATDWRGVMGHHTGGDAVDQTADRWQADYAAKGRTGVPGPLYNVLVGRDRCYLVADGYTNNAGKGCSAVLADTSHDTPPADSARNVYGWRKGRGDMTGNRHFMAVSLITGGQVGSVQAEQFSRACAALLHFQGWDERRYVSHKEWTSRKVDPIPPGSSIRLTIAERIQWYQGSQAPSLPTLPDYDGSQLIPNPVASVDSPRGGAYLLGADGGVFTARGRGGDVPPFLGSVGSLGIELPADVAAVDIAVGPRGDTYWVLVSDGGVLTFGPGPYHGSAYGMLEGRRPLGIHATAEGYAITTDDPEVTFHRP